MRIALFAALTTALLAGCDAAPMSQAQPMTDQRLDTARTALQNPAQRQSFMAQCQRMAGGYAPRDVANMGVLMNVSAADVPATFCNRMVAGVEDGRLSATDFEAMQRGEINPAILSVLQNR
ncbi:entry exclusion lipoprotein TrbK [Paracoccus laeviglucosivorans]|uniref:Entry exclusion lipoprotein TrbK n=1 Tax=Paracoccus laeviglucosivorans TaxID=1197861 RepID=A0A521CM03_9RHOB|nr:entry exclusion lipoprotein TrbK [Paracoccus laeviglucosivorans]SMO60483.1 entry exclusion lipoprotein TrbK [Paracoccus laeviglucosivorans]